MRLNKSLKCDTDIYNNTRKNIRKYRKLKRLIPEGLSDMVDLPHGFIR